MNVVDYRIANALNEVAPRSRKFKMHSGNKLSGRFRIQVINSDGTVAHERPWQNNLILDQGLDQCCNGTASLASAFTACAVGTGTTPTYTDSGAITVNITAGTATASASFFTVGMVGMLLVADTGEEQYITGFTSDTIVSVSGSESVSAQLFTVWAVNQTGLSSEVKRTTSYLTGAGNCGTTNTVGTGTRVLKRTFDFSTEVSPQNYEELGWSYTATPGSNLFSRVLIAGGTVTVLTSQQLRVVYELTIVVSPITSTPQTPTITGWPVAPAASTDGDYIANAQNFGSDQGGISAVGTAGNSGMGGRNQSLEPWGPFQMRLADGSVLPAFNAGYSPGTTTTQSSSSLAAYTPGNFYRDATSQWIASNGNRTDIRGITVVDADLYVFTFVFDEAQTKDNSHLLEITWRRTLGRTITNP